jgi:2'-5' RNA ligase
MARLFVAARPPAATLDLIEALPRPELPDVRWTPRDQWHVTLLFLADAELDEVADHLARLHAPVASARITGWSTIGRHVGALVVEGLDELAHAVERSVGVAADRPFRGHLTLARSRARGRLRVAAPAAMGDSPAASFAVTEVELVRSDLTRDGARHTVELVVPLASAG